MELNAAGDRKHDSYDFWGLCAAGETAVWYRVAVYRSRPEGGGTNQGLLGCGGAMNPVNVLSKPGRNTRPASSRNERSSS
jgi:hypothetical protein